MIRQLTTIQIIFFILASCNESADRPELINSLRALGCKHEYITTPPSTIGSDALVNKLTIFASVPLEKTVTISPYIDIPSPTAYNATESDIKISPDSVTYEEHNKLRLFSVTATVNVPYENVLNSPLGPLQGIQVKYGFKLKTEDKEELLIGSFLVFREDAPERAWTNPELDTISPVESSSINESTDLELTILDHNAEDVKTGWFSTSGEVTNRRAQKTTLEKIEKGPQTIIATIRGKQSRGFDIKVIDVNVE